MGSRFTEDDFGITHLASMFHQDWGLSGSACDVVKSYVDLSSDAYVIALAEDAMRLTDEGAADFSATLWECVTGSYHRIEDGPLAGRDWFREISDTCKRELEQSGSHSIPQLPERRFGDFKDRVVGEIDGLEDSLNEAISSRSLMGASGVVALRKCALMVCPELAFRALLRVLMMYSCEIDLDRYERFLRLGRDFSYGEFVVSRVSFLVI